MEQTKTCVVYGVKYVSKEAPQPGTCAGCVAETHGGLCFTLGRCKGLIWVKAAKPKPSLASVVAKLTPQAALLLKYITSHGSVTQREALMDLKIQSLTKRISELRNHFDIKTEFRHHKTTGQRYARYHYRGLRSDE